MTRMLAKYELAKGDGWGTYKLRWHPDAIKDDGSVDINSSFKD